MNMFLNSCYGNWLGTSILFDQILYSANFKLTTRLKTILLIHFQHEVMSTNI